MSLQVVLSKDLLVHYSHQRIKFGDAVDVCVREERAQNMQRVIDITPKITNQRPS